MNETDKAVWRGILVFARSHNSTLECSALAGLVEAHPGEPGDLAKAAREALVACSLGSSETSYEQVQERMARAVALDEYLGGGWFAEAERRNKQP